MGVAPQDLRSKTHKPQPAVIKVIPGNLERMAPLVGYFPSGFDPDLNSTKVGVFRHKERGGTRLQLVVTPEKEPKVDFVGTSYAGEAQVFRLEPKVQGVASSNMELASSVVGKLAALEKAEKLTELHNRYETRKSICQVEDKKNKLACILSYIVHLIKFKDLHSIPIKAERSMVPEWLSSAKGHRLPSIIRDKFSTMFDAVSRTLSTEKSCKVSKKNNLSMVTLPVPLQFSTLKRKRKLKNELERVNGDGIHTAARPYAFLNFDKFIQKTKKLYQDTRTLHNISMLNDEVSEVNIEVSEVYQTMKRNVLEVLVVGDNMDKLSEKTNCLVSETRAYAKKGRDLNRQALPREWTPAAVIVLGVVFLLFWLQTKIY
ncbi:hypothetical protein ACLB2K_067777 [Fragaria x ananassa]